MKLTKVLASVYVDQGIDALFYLDNWLITGIDQEHT